MTVNMYKFVSAVLVVLCLFGKSQAQTNGKHQLKINKILQGYFQATEQMNWKKALAFWYPDFLELVSEDELKNLFQQLELEGVETKLQNSRIDSISNLAYYERDKYAMVYCSYQIYHKFTDPEFQSAKEERADQWQ